ncbi:MAG: RNase adapter RapZ [Desulfohalobiaceae bacterium]
MKQQKKQILLIIVTGLSGAGKSTALNVFEDLGFFCVDGLPSGMIYRMAHLFQKENPGNYRGLALGIDVRQGNLLRDWERAMSQLSKQDIQPQILFLESSLDKLVQRYAETRRPHPLASTELGLEQAIRKEMELLEPLRKEVDLILDTTDFSLHDLRRALQRNWSFMTEPSMGLRVHLLSFGYKYGVPREADLVFDLRFLPNPHFEPELSKISGREDVVREYVFRDGVGSEFKRRFLDFLLYVLPLYAREGRYRVAVALGCTGGFHRSVAVAEEVYNALLREQYNVSLEHRHLELG